LGEENVKSVIIENTDSHDTSEVITDGVFVEIGLDPNSSFAKGVVEMNKYER
jgi:alkyl hydroperoxide reductase subunit F